MGISNWVSLNNDGELLQLIHDNGVDEELVFYLSYHHDWHTSIDAQEGGFSLEMKDVANPCAGQVNWTTSKDLDGGTPGRENSVKVSVPDNFPPSVLSFEGSSNQLTLQFDEILDFRNLPTLNVEPETGIHNVSWSVQEPQELSVEVSELVANADYMLIVSGAEDCLGNRTESQELKFVLPVEASADQLKISEVLFDPRPDEADFIEVFNDSDQYLDLRGFVISNEKEGFVVSNTSLNIPPRSFRVFTENVSDLQHAFPQSVREALVSVDRLPSMPNDQGVVRLINQSGLVIDSLPYEEDFHSILLDDTEGVSIERISYASPTYDRNNWHSASASVGFATPGYHNSQALESQASSKLMVEPKVFVPGSATAGAKSFTTVNYQFEEPGLFANIFIYNQNGQQVRQLAHGTSLATKGFIQWDGTDDSGSPVRLGYYIIAMEVWSSSGKRELLKESVVVGAEF
ncbi:MAG: lamin tail domain-containing protein [Cyclobacteriaceae bacterium]|nr:lamin tail domain-containing protein [Cyclobacteriaceae bacterium HetDA_MAG_MS6]